MAVVLHNVMKFVGKSTVQHIADPQLDKKFKDYNTVSEYANHAVSNLLTIDLMKGSDGLIAPKKDATRAEAVTLLKNVLGYTEFLSE